MPGKSDSVHFLRLPSYDKTCLNEDAVMAMSNPQAIVELCRNVCKKRNISLRSPIKSVTVLLRNPTPVVVDAIKGPLKNYILSEINA
jgi:isoleucyl-tRNA synthetase